MRFLCIEIYISKGRVEYSQLIEVVHVRDMQYHCGECIKTCKFIMLSDGIHLNCFQFDEQHILFKLLSSKLEMDKGITTTRDNFCNSLLLLFSMIGGYRNTKKVREVTGILNTILLILIAAIFQVLQTKWIIVIYEDILIKYWKKNKTLRRQNASYLFIKSIKRYQRSINKPSSRLNTNNRLTITNKHSEQCEEISSGRIFDGLVVADADIDSKQPPDENFEETSRETHQSSSQPSFYTCIVPTGNAKKKKNIDFRHLNTSHHNLDI